MRAVSGRGSGQRTDICLVWLTATAISFMCVISHTASKHPLRILFLYFAAEENEVEKGRLLLSCPLY
jgi:hypothetical protein